MKDYSESDESSQGYTCSLKTAHEDDVRPTVRPSGQRHLRLPHDLHKLSREQRDELVTGFLTGLNFHTNCFLFHFRDEGVRHLKVHISIEKNRLNLVQSRFYVGLGDFRLTSDDLYDSTKFLCETSHLKQSMVVPCLRIRSSKRKDYTCQE